MAFGTTPEYKEAIAKDTRVTFIDGTIITEQGTEIPLGNSLLDTGGFYITNQCVNGDSFEYGSVFASELGITIKTEVDRYALYNAEIKPFFNILVGRNQYERIPLGVFRIDEPNRVGRNITIKAYDRMIDLEEEIIDATVGDVYEMLLFISSRCGVPLEQNRSDIERLVNGKTLVSVSPTRVGTYRELLSYLCQITCTFAAINRVGELCLYEFKTEPVKVIDAKQRTASKFSDFETHFTGAKANLIYGEAYKGYAQVIDDTGIIYNMGDIPIVQGLDTTNLGVVANVAHQLESVRYTPCDISFNGDPSLDLGDMIQSTDRDGRSYLSLVTFYKWTYRGKHQIKSAGQNPKMAKIKGKGSKEMDNLRADVTAKEISVYTFTNASAVSVSGISEDVEAESSVANISFAAKRASTCVVNATFPFNLSEDGVVIFHQLFDGTVMQGGTIKQRCFAGENVISFTNYFATESNTIHRYSIVAETSAGTATIQPFESKVVVFGQGLEALVQWDGTILIGDVIPPVEVTVNKITVTSIVDGNITVGSAPYNPRIVNDVFGYIDVTRHFIDSGTLSDELTTS